ncbi:MAG: VWA domain-containing protein [Armatimonadota bacterium]|nr:VWA domain-containing protein [Armatimonadota bacterium]MDR7427405.1 VWA domain-containing protein [Armatimonadota bacterium]MDR7463838.1 VWA domain-containing protein [Armatimonadota bacterium]MDR7470142.1 VWA domain-containing protein [Armatimonadota bacterium]MDR7474992.1 VWA domain-containing protein [Armatimonadota bacterium]
MVTRSGSLAANVVAFTRLLRQRGLPAGPREASDALRALAAVDLLDRREVYLTLRSVLVERREHFQEFDQAFRAFWCAPEEERPEVVPPPDGTVPEGPAEAERVLREWLQAEDEEQAEGEETRETPGYSPAEVLTRKDFSALSSDELEEMTALVVHLARRVATRMSRRMRAMRRGHLLDVRRTVRRSLRRGGEIMELLRRRRRIQKTQVVLLCDVSGSMDLYSRFLVQFIYALQHAVSRVETFVFSTSLTRVTPALSDAELSRALDRVARTVPNWSGGTKIGYSLRQFLDQYGPRLLGERTVVVIISDGWDTGEVEVLEAAMRQLNRQSARVIWLNPLLGGAGYEPLCQGMRAALPHVDVFAPAHNLESLRRLERHLALPR